MCAPRRSSVTQMSASNSNIGSAANSPQCQQPVSFSRAKEDDEEMHQQYAAVDAAHEELAASARGDGERVELTPPLNAKWCPAALRGRKGTFYLHIRTYEHNDGKMDSLLYRAARGSASTARCGGIRCDVKKSTLLRPRARIVEPDAADARPDDWRFHTDDWIGARVREVAAETERLRGLGKLTDSAINDFCFSKGHAFTQGIAPYLSVRVALWGPLHLDNNLVQRTIEMYNTLAEDMDAFFKLDLKSEFSYRRKLYAAMRATGRRLGRHVDGIEARYIGGEHKTFRIAGDDGIDFFQYSFTFDDAVRVAPPHADARGFWWLQRAALAARARLHRALSAYQVRDSLDIDDVDVMIALGEMYQFVHKHTGLAVTYSDFYLTKGNPYFLKKLSPTLHIADEHGVKTRRIFGIARLAGEQGGERYNAFHKVEYPMISSGRPGSELQYMESLYVTRLALMSGDFEDTVPLIIKKNQRKRWPEEKEDDHEPRGGGGGGGDDIVVACACGRPTTGDGLELLARDVRCADALRLRSGSLVCPTCQDAARAINELDRDAATGMSKDVIELVEYQRKKEAAQVRFDTAEEARRVRAETEARAAEMTATTADLMELEGDPDEAAAGARARAAPDASSSESDTPHSTAGLRL